MLRSVVYLGSGSSARSVLVVVVDVRTCQVGSVVRMPSKRQRAGEQMPDQPKARAWEDGDVGLDVIDEEFCRVRRLASRWVVSSCGRLSSGTIISCTTGTRPRQVR